MFLEGESSHWCQVCQINKDQKEPPGSDNKSLTLANQSCCCCGGGGVESGGGNIETANANDSFMKSGEERVDDRWRSGDAFFFFFLAYWKIFEHIKLLLWVELCPSKFTCWKS